MALVTCICWFPGLLFRAIKFIDFFNVFVIFLFFDYLALACNRPTSWDWLAASSG